MKHSNRLLPVRREPIVCTVISCLKIQNQSNPYPIVYEKAIMYFNGGCILGRYGTG